MTRGLPYLLSLGLAHGLFHSAVNDASLSQINRRNHADMTFIVIITAMRGQGPPSLRLMASGPGVCGLGIRVSWEVLQPDGAVVSQVPQTESLAFTVISKHTSTRIQVSDINPAPG